MDASIYAQQYADRINIQSVLKGRLDRHKLMPCAHVIESWVKSAASYIAAALVTECKSERGRKNNRERSSLVTAKGTDWSRTIKYQCPVLSSTIGSHVRRPWAINSDTFMHYIMFIDNHTHKKACSLSQLKILCRVIEDTQPCYRDLILETFQNAGIGWATPDVIYHCDLLLMKFAVWIGKIPIVDLDTQMNQFFSITDHHVYSCPGILGTNTNLY